MSVNVLCDDPPLVSIPELDFAGSMSQSPNKEFTVAFADGCETANGWRGGYRESGHGTVLLISNERLLWMNEVARPMEVAVSDRGDVAVCDAGFGMDLKGTILIFGPDGTRRVQDFIHANLYTCAMTPEGDYAVFNSCVSDVEADSGKLFAYAVPSATRLFVADFVISPITCVTYAEGTLTVTANGLECKYSLIGECGTFSRGAHTPD